MPPEVDRMLRLVVAQTPEHALILLDADAHIVWINPKAASLFGYTMEQVTGRKLELLFVPEDIERGIPEFEIQTALTRKSGEDDRWMQRADGTRFWAIGCMVKLEDEQGDPIGFCKILEDRTDLKEQIEVLRNRVARLTRSDEERSSFIGTLGHEVRNTITPIANALEIIRLKTQADNSEMVLPIKLIERQLDFIKRLVDDLLDVTRMQTGKVAMNLDPADLRDVVREAADSVRSAIQSRSQRLDLVLVDSPTMVCGDRDRLHQVFVNLLINAYKFTPEGGQITIDVSTEGAEVVVKITDTGVGIAPEDLSRIFDLFTQADSVSFAERGLGIGLALVREFVALHDGVVTARSDGPGKGSQFIVRLPLYAPRAASRAD